jgi:hypothetical protein
MKRVIKSTIMMCLLFTAHIVFGQKDSTKRQKFEALRTQILINKLDLTQEEQAAFLPIYAEFKNREKALHRKERKLLKAAKADSISNSEASNILAKLKKVRLAQARLFSNYTDKFLAVLPAEKVVKLYAVEREIKRIIAAKIRERKK